MADRFTLSLRPDIALDLNAEQITLRSQKHSLTLPSPKPGLKAALAQLKNGALTLTQLTMLVAELDGVAEGHSFAAELQKLIHLGWICHAVLPYAIAVPIAEDYDFVSTAMDENPMDGLKQPLILSRFAYLRRDHRQLVLESPLSKTKILLLNWQVTALITLLAAADSALTPEQLAELPLATEAVQAILHLLITTQMIGLEPENPTLAQWQFHNLLFHRQTRLERHPNLFHAPVKPFKGHDRYPFVKPVIGTQVIALTKPDLATLAHTDMSLTQALETRQSIRDYGEQPITLPHLAELLYRCARVQEVYTREDDVMGVGDWTKRPYPSGGGLYELEIYPIIHNCTGLEPGLYHYQPLAHTLHLISDHSPEVESLTYQAWRATGQQGIPQVVLMITARFGRLFWKYHEFGYGLILKHVGVLYQTFYLVATALELAPCAMGIGPSEKFCQIAGLNEYEESSVGEFCLGSRQQ